MKLPKTWSKPPTTQSLHKWHIWLCILFAAQALAILLLATSRTFPISASFLTVDSLQSTAVGRVVLAPATHHLFELNMAYLVGASLLVASLVHLGGATVYRPRYEAALAHGVNRLRWFSVAISGGLMALAVAVLAGMYDLVSLAFLFALIVVVAALGLAIEVHNPLRSGRPKIGWGSFVLGCVVGFVAWLGVVYYLFAADVLGSGHVPTFMYYLVGSAGVLMLAAPVNLYLTYKQSGPWKNYNFAERKFMILSLVLLSALAWQIFAGVLRP